MGWYASAYRGPLGRADKRRAIAWRCTTDSRVEVRHCGHPTALHPYYVVLDGADTYPERGSFRRLEEAQQQALLMAATTNQ